jgi:hypothetical protein
MPETIAIVLEHRGGTARIIGVFASRDLAVDVARSHADHTLQRIAERAGDLFGAIHKDLASYEIRCETDLDCVHVRIRNRLLGEFEDPSWLVQTFTIVGVPQIMLTQTHQPPLFSELVAA